MNSNERPNSLVKTGAALLVCIVAASAPLAGGVAAQNFENLLMPASSQNGTGLSSEELNFLTVEKENPLWTTYTFLRAEHLSAQQEYAKAADLYFNLVKQAHSDSKKDTWGGGSLAAFALYRWLTVHLQFPQADSSKFQELSALADDLLQQRLVRAAYEAHAVMPSLPFLEEELYHLLATAADAAKMSDKAGRYYLQYLVSMQHDSHAVDAENGSSLYRTVLEKGIATPDRIALFRAKRLFEKNLRQKAVPYMKEAHKSNSDDIRLEAAYLLARASKMPRTEKDRLYNEVYEYTSNRDLAQEALYWNALEYGFNDPQFALYLQKLIKEFPRHKYTDDALYWLGRSEQIKGNLDAALDWYRRTAEIKKHNNHAGRAAYSSSLGLILRALSADRDAAGKTADLRQAGEILKKFQADHADSILQPHARFWLGRIAELLGENKEAARWFADCSAAFPFTY
ncbi:MAG TPA: tetratricopeptide repeat protein, partial [Methylomicrobium sp.]|nr:tetratricopeptide repeat protein [Methylomicrobium sp.]